MTACIGRHAVVTKRKAELMHGYGSMGGSDWVWMFSMMGLLVIGVATAIYFAIRASNRPPEQHD